MSKSDPSTNKAKPITFRPSTDVTELLEWYLESRGGNKTKAIQDLMRIGGTVLIQREYKDET